MPVNDGLPSGPVLQPNLNLNVPQSQGLTRGSVAIGVGDILRNAAGGSDLNVFNAVSGTSGGGAPAFHDFQGGVADPLQHIQSTLESSISTSSGPGKAIFDAIMTGLSRPVSTISDGLSRLGSAGSIGGRLARIDQLQQNFFQNHAGDLTHMDDAMGSALKSIRDLGYLLQPDSMDKFHLSAGPLQQILEQKQQVGRELSGQLADAIANTDDPDEKSRLQAEKDDVDAWMAQSDQRIAADANEISNLQQRTNAVMRTAGAQSDALVNAAFSGSPSNVTSDGKIVSTTHTQPDAVAYAMGLRQSLIQSRVQMNTAMAGR